MLEILTDNEMRLMAENDELKDILSSIGKWAEMESAEGDISPWNNGYTSAASYIKETYFE